MYLQVFNSQIKFTRGFRNVRRFSLERVFNLSDFITIIRGMWHLEKLTMGFHPDVRLPL